MREKIQKEIEKRIEQMPRDYVFSAKDFADISNQDASNQALCRLEKDSKIKRIITGFYYVPVFIELIGEYSAPRIDLLAEAIARKFNWSIAPSGNTSLNLLGLSTQVPAKWSFISTGPYRCYDIGGINLEFLHRANKIIEGKSLITVMVIEALRVYREERVNEKTIMKLKNLLTKSDKEKLLSEARQTTSWIYSSIKKICND